MDRLRQIYVPVVVFLFVVIAAMPRLSAQTGEELVQFMEYDYGGLLVSLQELRAEMKDAPKNIKNEIKLAQKGLIKDYTAGDYAIFSSNAVIETAWLEQINKASKDKIDAYLKNYVARSYGEPQINVREVIKSKGKWLIYYESKGEVSSQWEERRATISNFRDGLRIDYLGYDKETLPEPQVVVQETKTKKQETKAVNNKPSSVSNTVKNTEVVSAPKVKEQEAPKKSEVKQVKKEAIAVVENAPKKEKKKLPPPPAMPKIIIEDIVLDSHHILVNGKVEKSKNDGILSATLDEVSLPKIPLDQARDNSFRIRYDRPTTQTFDVVLRYSYGERFVVLRKSVTQLNPSGAVSQHDSDNSETDIFASKDDHE